MKSILKIVKSLGDSGLLLKGINATKEQKNKKVVFFVLLGTLGGSLLGKC